jgi:GTP cyclohydrolase I
VRTLLSGVGEYPDRQGLRDTPKVCLMLLNLCRSWQHTAACVPSLAAVRSAKAIFATLQRVAKAWLDITAGYSQNVDSVLGQALFDEPTVSSGGGGMVLVRASVLMQSLPQLPGRAKAFGMSVVT